MSRTRRPRRRVRSLRVRLTLAFGSVVALVLAVTGVLVFVQYARDLDARTDEELADRRAAVETLASAGALPARLTELSGEAFAQVYRGTTVVASTARVQGTRILAADQVRRAAAGPRLLTVRGFLPGDDDGARVAAFPVRGGGVVAIAEPLAGRETDLHRLAILLALGLPAALVLASLAGYQVAGAALRPVERMRARAAAIGAADLTERLPEPGTQDELDRLATTLNDLLERLHAALERERRIVADASHELRTPIAVLRTRLDVALRGGGGEERLREVLGEALHDSERLSRLADDLLVLARADQGQLPLRREPLDVQDALERAAARHDAVGVAVEIPGGAVVLADPDRVDQALDNLLVNAERYGRPPVALHARPGPGETVELVVRDHGDGFDPSFLPHAFERFSQADPAHGGPGSGLGLAIVDALARAQGGTARAGNRPDGGAEIAFTLPRA